MSQAYDELEKADNLKESILEMPPPSQDPSKLLKEPVQVIEEVDEEDHVKIFKKPKLMI